MTSAQLSAKRQASQQLVEAIGTPNQILASATTVFPLTIFPDTITLSRSQLTIAHRSFFQVAQTASVQIADVLDVTSNVGPFFGSLKISTRFFDNRRPFFINWLLREDALKMKRIIQGYMIATLKEVDMTALSTPELAKMLNELGKGAPDDGN